MHFVTGVVDGTVKELVIFNNRGSKLEVDRTYLMRLEGTKIVDFIPATKKVQEKFRNKLLDNLAEVWYTVYSEGGDKMIETFIGSLLGAIIGIMIAHTSLHDKGE